MRVRSVVVVLLAGLVVIAGSPSLADRTGMRDETDSFGPFDVKRIVHSHRRFGNGLVHKITTWRRWGKGALNNDYSDIHILFTTDGDNKPERALVIDTEGGRIAAVMHRWANGVREQTFGRAAVSRPNRRSIRVVFRRSLLGRGVREYGWHVDTRFHKPRHPTCNVSGDGKIVVCPDSAPNSNAPRAYLRH
jgi:hypothetical protein